MEKERYKMDNIKIPGLPKYVSKLKLNTIKVKIDILTLENIIGFIYKDSVLRTRKALSTAYKLFMLLDDDLYNKDIELVKRVWVIRKSLEARLKEGFENESMIKQYCINHMEADDMTNAIINNIDIYKKQITHDEIKYLIKMIDDRLRFGYTVSLKEGIQSIMDRIDDGDFKSYQSVGEELYNIATSIIALKRNTNSLDSDNTFSLDDDVFENVVTDSVMQLKDKNRVFITGIKRLNTLLSPGYMSKRLYTYLAFPAGGKSQMLLKGALDILKYNKTIKPKDPKKIPTVLFLTLENDIDETIERIFNILVTSDDIRNYTPKQVIRKLKTEGNLVLDGSTNNIDLIIKYYDNRIIDTNDIRSIIEDLADSGKEVIALFVDYLKRVKPAEKADTEKTEMRNVTNELKSLAKAYDIPVITAQQLNRASASVVDAAIQAKKEDITRLVGRDGISTAWEILENSDWCCIINKEVKADDSSLYLTFKLLKRRYRSSAKDTKLRRLDYFNHPYDPDNEIKLIDDIDREKSISLYSLATTFVPFEENKRGKKNAADRKGKKNSLDEEFEPFDFDNMMN